MLRLLVNGRSSDVNYHVVMDGVIIRYSQVSLYVRKYGYPN